MLFGRGSMPCLLPIVLALFASWTPTGARVIHKRAAFYIANETMCIVDGVVFRNGNPVPTDDECERCTCRPPGFSCVLRDCDTKPGCKAVRKVGECCPEYVCGCVHNNRVYEDGEVIRDLQNACYTCRCHGSSISCTFAECLFRGDCQPEYVQGECCPRYDHCPPLSTSAPSTIFTTQSSTTPHIIQQEIQFINLTTQHLEKLTSVDTIVTVEDIIVHSSTAITTTPSYETSTPTSVTVKFTLTDGPISSIFDFDITTLSTLLPLQTTTYTETTRYVIPDADLGDLTTQKSTSIVDLETTSSSTSSSSTEYATIPYTRDATTSSTTDATTPIAADVTTSSPIETTTSSTTDSTTSSPIETTTSSTTDSTIFYIRDTTTPITTDVTSSSTADTTLSSSSDASSFSTVDETYLTGGYYSTSIAETSELVTENKTDLHAEESFDVNSTGDKIGVTSVTDDYVNTTESLVTQTKDLFETQGTTVSHLTSTNLYEEGLQNVDKLEEESLAFNTSEFHSSTVEEDDEKRVSNALSEESNFTDSQSTTHTSDPDATESYIFTEEKYTTEDILESTGATGVSDSQSLTMKTLHDDDAFSVEPSVEASQTSDFTELHSPVETLDTEKTISTEKSNELTKISDTTESQSYTKVINMEDEISNEESSKVTKFEYIPDSFNGTVGHGEDLSTEQSIEKYETTDVTEDHTSIGTLVTQETLGITQLHSLNESDHKKTQSTNPSIYGVSDYRTSTEYHVATNTSTTPGEENKVKFTDNANVGFTTNFDEYLLETTKSSPAENQFEYETGDTNHTTISHDTYSVFDADGEQSVATEDFDSEITFDTLPEFTEISNLDSVSKTTMELSFESHDNSSPSPQENKVHVEHEIASKSTDETVSKTVQDSEMNLAEENKFTSSDDASVTVEKHLNRSSVFEEGNVTEFGTDVSSRLPTSTSKTIPQFGISESVSTSSFSFTDGYKTTLSNDNKNQDPNETPNNKVGTNVSENVTPEIISATEEEQNELLTDAIESNTHNISHLSETTKLLATTDDISADVFNTAIYLNGEVTNGITISTQKEVTTSTDPYSDSASLEDLNLSTKTAVLTNQTIESDAVQILKEFENSTKLFDSENSTFGDFTKSESYDTNSEEQTDDVQEAEILQSSSVATVDDGFSNEITENVLVTLHPMKTDLSGLITLYNKDQTKESQSTNEESVNNFKDASRVTESFYGKQTKGTEGTLLDETSTSSVNEFPTDKMFFSKDGKTQSTIYDIYDTSIDHTDAENIDEDRLDQNTTVDEPESAVEDDDFHVTNTFSGGVITSDGVPGEGLYTKSNQFDNSKANDSSSILFSLENDSLNEVYAKIEKQYTNQALKPTVAYVDEDELVIATSKAPSNVSYNSIYDETTKDYNDTSNDYVDLVTEISWTIEKNITEDTYTTLAQFNREQNVTGSPNNELNETSDTTKDELYSNALNYTTILFEEQNTTHGSSEDYNALDGEEDIENESLESKQITNDLGKPFEAKEQNSTSPDQDLTSTPYAENGPPETSEEDFTKVINDSFNTKEIVSVDSDATTDEAEISNGINKVFYSTPNIYNADENGTYEEKYNDISLRNTSETSETLPLDLELTESHQNKHISSEQQKYDSISSAETSPEQNSEVTTSSTHYTNTHVKEETYTTSTFIFSTFSSSVSEKTTMPQRQIPEAPVLPNENPSSHTLHSNGELHSSEPGEQITTADGSVSVLETQVLNIHSSTTFKVEDAENITNEEEENITKKEENEEHILLKNESLSEENRLHATNSGGTVPEDAVTLETSTAVLTFEAPLLDIETLSPLESFNFNNHRGRVTKPSTTPSTDTENISTRQVQILFGQTPDSLVSENTELNSVTSNSESSPETESHRTVDENNFGSAMHEYDYTTSTLSNITTGITHSDKATIAEEETTNEDIDSYDHEYDSEEMTELNTNITKTSISYRGETARNLDVSTSEDTSVTDKTGSFTHTNTSSYLITELSHSQSNVNASHISHKENEFTDDIDENSSNFTPEVTPSQDQFSVIGYLGDLFSGINVYSSSATPDPVNVSEGNISVSEYSHNISKFIENHTDKTFDTSELGTEKSPDSTSSSDYAASVSTENNSHRDLITDNNDEKNNDNLIDEESVSQYQSTILKSTEDYHVKGFISNSNSSNANEDAEKHLQVALDNLASIEDGPEKGGELFKPTLPNTVDAAMTISHSDAEDKASEDTFDSIATTLEKSEQNQKVPEEGGESFEPTIFPLNSVAEEQKSTPSNESEEIVAVPSEISSKTTFAATTLSTFVRLRAKGDGELPINTSTPKLLLKPASSDSGDNRTDEESDRLITKESLHVAETIEVPNATDSDKNYSIIDSTTESSNSLSSHTDTQSSSSASDKSENYPMRGGAIREGNETHLLQPYSLIDVISNVFKAPGYDSEVHSSFLKEQVDFSKKEKPEKPVVIVKRDAGQDSTRIPFKNSATSQTGNSAIDPHRLHPFKNPAVVISQSENSETYPHRLETKKIVSNEGFSPYFIHETKPRDPAPAAVTSSFIFVAPEEEGNRFRWRFPIRNPAGEIQEIELPASFTFPPSRKFPSKSVTTNKN